MKRYLAFAGDIDGESGADSLIGDFDTIEDARAAIGVKNRPREFGLWAHVYDSETRAVIERWRPATRIIRDYREKPTVWERDEDEYQIGEWKP